MKSEEVYNIWKDQKSQIETGKNFPEAVMNQIYQHEKNKRKSLFDIQQLVELISAHPLAKAGLVAAGAIIGLIRLISMIVVILSRGVING